jgi:hypothetical protein
LMTSAGMVSKWWHIAAIAQGIFSVIIPLSPNP